MTLISLAIVVAFGTSLAATFGLFEIDVWWEVASLITIMVLGHWLEMRAISQARGALDALAALLPDTAERVTGDEITIVLLSALHVGDIILVRPGARVAADGAVVEGSADVDESMITGESRMVSRGPGDKVIAGTVASWREPSSPHFGSRGTDGSVRHRAARCCGAGFWISRAGSRRPCSCDPFLRSSGVGGDHLRLLVAFRGQRTRPDQNGNRPRRSPARTPLD